MFFLPYWCSNSLYCTVSLLFRNILLAILIPYVCWWQIFLVFWDCFDFPFNSWRIFPLERTFQLEIGFLSWPFFSFNTSSILWPPWFVSNNNYPSVKTFSPLGGVSFLSVSNIYIFLFVFQKFEYDVPSRGFLWIYPVWDLLGFLYL